MANRPRLHKAVLQKTRGWIWVTSAFCEMFIGLYTPHISRMFRCRPFSVLCYFGCLSTIKVWDIAEERVWGWPDAFHKCSSDYLVLFQAEDVRLLSLFTSWASYREAISVSSVSDSIDLTNHFTAFWTALSCIIFFAHRLTHCIWYWSTKEYAVYCKHYSSACRARSRVRTYLSSLCSHKSLWAVTQTLESKYSRKRGLSERRARLRNLRHSATTARECLGVICESESVSSLCAFKSFSWHSCCG